MCTDRGYFFSFFYSLFRHVCFAEKKSPLRNNLCHFMYFKYKFSSDNWNFCLRAKSRFYWIFRSIQFIERLYILPFPKRFFFRLFKIVLKGMVFIFMSTVCNIVNMAEKITWMLGFKRKKIPNMYPKIRWNSTNVIKVSAFMVKENLQSEGVISKSLKCSV